MISRKPVHRHPDFELQASPGIGPTMKTMICALFFLCAASAAFSQAAGVSATVQPLQMADHPQHASQHSMAQESSLFSTSGYDYAQGEVPLAELGSPIYETPLGDIARSYRKERTASNSPKAAKVSEN
jgi:hypothetical protein